MATSNTRGGEIAARIRSLLKQDDGGGSITMAHNAVAKPDGAFLTQYELDLVDWGLVAGIAFTLAPLHDPLESNEAAVARALPAAIAAYRAWSGGDVVVDPQHWVNAHPKEA